MITRKSEHISIEGHLGTWYIISEKDNMQHGKLFLLEHETHGDDAPCLIVNEAGAVIVDNVHNGFLDYDEWLACQMDYPKNKTRLFKFLQANPGIYFKVDHSERGTQMRRLKKAQTNGFSGLDSDGKQVWFHHDKNFTYAFEGSTVCVTTKWCQFVYDFNPSAEEIQAYEAALAQSGAGGATT